MTGVLPVKNFVTKGPWFGRMSPYLEGSPYINNLALDIIITNVSTILTGKYFNSVIPTYTSSLVNICLCIDLDKEFNNMTNHTKQKLNNIKHMLSVYCF